KPIWISVICAISIAPVPPNLRDVGVANPPRRSLAFTHSDQLGLDRCALIRVVAMAHRAARGDLRLARILAEMAIAAFGNSRQQQIARALRGLSRVARGAFLLLVIGMTEPAVREVAAVLKDRHHAQ